MKQTIACLYYYNRVLKDLVSTFKTIYIHILSGDAPLDGEFATKWFNHKTFSVSYTNYENAKESIKNNNLFHIKLGPRRNLIATEKTISVLDKMASKSLCSKCIYQYGYLMSGKCGNSFLKEKI